jgi:RsiW-degrading membrane proteinase PrsW (M82 family)
MIENSLVVIIISMLLYSTALSFSIHYRRIQKKLLILVVWGLIIGIGFSGSIVTILEPIPNIMQFSESVNNLLFAPITEELSKLLGITFGLFVISKKEFPKFDYEQVRFGSGVGLGFGILETLSYALKGSGFDTIVARLLVTVPVHTSLAMMISYGFVKKGNRVFLASLMVLAISLHILSNTLAYVNSVIQGLVFWIILITEFLLCEKYSKFKDSGVI